MNYETLYHIMVNGSERAIEAIENGNPALAREILINAEQKAEEEYCRWREAGV